MFGEVEEVGFVGEEMLKMICYHNLPNSRSSWRDAMEMDFAL